MNQLLRTSIRTVARVASVVPHGQSVISGLENYFAQVQGIGYVASMEEEVRAALHCIDSSAPVVLDVGANRGHWTQALLAASPAGAKVYAFDPSPTNIKALQAIGDSRINVVPMAMANFEGSSVLHTPAPGSELGSLFDFRPSESRPVDALAHETVDVTTLDAFVKDRQITSIDFMKMDLEGAEFPALQGGMETLKKGIVRALSFEFGQCNIASKTYLLDFWYLLNGLSYTLNLLGPNGILIPVKEYSPRFEVLRHSNFTAVYKGAGYRPTQYHR